MLHMSVHQEVLKKSVNNLSREVISAEIQNRDFLDTRIECFLLYHDIRIFGYRTLYQLLRLCSVVGDHVE